MSTQTLNKRTFSSRALSGMCATTTTATMSALGVSVKTLFFSVIALSFGAIGWRNASDVVSSTSVV